MRDGNSSLGPGGHCGCELGLPCYQKMLSVSSSQVNRRWLKQKAVASCDYALLQWKMNGAWIQLGSQGACLERAMWAENSHVSFQRRRGVHEAVVKHVVSLSV